MKFSLAVFGLLITVQSICSAPVDIEESITDVQPRVFPGCNSIPSGTALQNMPGFGTGGGGGPLSSFFNSFGSLFGNLANNPIASAGSSAISGLPSMGSSALGALSSLVSRNLPATDVEGEEELVDFIKALVQHINSEGHTSVAVDQDVDGSIVSHDAIVEKFLPNVNEDSVEETPLYVMVVD